MEFIKKIRNKVVLTNNDIAFITNFVIDRKELEESVNNKELIPLRETLKYMLFYRKDIEQYLKKRKVIISNPITKEQLANELIKNKNVLVGGGMASGKSYLIENVINILNSFKTTKKINVMDLISPNSNANIFHNFNDSFFLKDEMILIRF